MLESQLFWWGLGIAVLVVWMVLMGMVKIPAPALLFCIVVIVAALVVGYLLLGDKNNDGASDNMLIVPVQPMGDVDTDTEYAQEVNPDNAKSNVINAAAVGIYTLLFVMVMFGVVFVAVIIKGIFS